MSEYRQDDDPLAYGNEYSASRGQAQGEGDRGIIGDTFRKLKSRYDQRPSPTQNYGYNTSGSGQQPSYGQQSPNPSYPSPAQSTYSGGPPSQQSSQKPDLASKLLGGLQSTIQTIGSDVAGMLGPKYGPQQAPGQYGSQQIPGQQGSAVYHSTSVPHQSPGVNRFESFAAEKPGNEVKWYVDGCGYFWAVSQALEEAKESIWILDWWLSPELYLRRPPSKNEQWRLDRVLQRAAQRGVKVNVIVYKEVTQALSAYCSSPVVSYLHSLLPKSTDAVTSAFVHLGLQTTATSLAYVERTNPLIDPPLALSSAHTKHVLEALSPNIGVFRHPDHLPDAQTAQSSLISSFQGLKLDAAGVSKLGSDALKGIYGLSDDVILYWAHHEKLCLIDGKTAFMGGLDMCFGRWDTNQHSIADSHPTDLQQIVFPGQDFNDARVMDFHDVANPLENKLDRTKSSRMGWSDIALSLAGPCVEDLRHHFIDRWNFIYDEKYNVRKDIRYSRLIDNYPHAPGQQPEGAQKPQSQSYLQTPQQGQPYPPPPGSQPYNQPAWQSTSRPHTPNALNPQPVSPGAYSPGLSQTQSYTSPQQYPPPPPGPPPPQNYPSSPYEAQHPNPEPTYTPYGGNISELPAETIGENPYHHQNYQSPPQSQSRGFNDYDEFQSSDRGFSDERGFGGKFNQYRQQGNRIGQELGAIGTMVSGAVEGKVQQYQGKHSSSGSYGQAIRGRMTCQILRSCTKWSNGTQTESSIQKAYIDVIQNSKHFVYIENQFFITATGESQKPVKNLIGKALVDRILRAARSGEKYKVIVIIPSVPAFAGDLRDDASLGTRAIMEFQYDSINRGGHSIMEMIAQAGFNPMDYIRFYNLRNYDRINTGAAMSQVERQSGVSYEDARKQHDDSIGAGYGGYGEGTGVHNNNQASQYQQYQAAAQNVSSKTSPRWDSVAECYMLGGQDIRTVPWDGSPESELDAFVSEELYIHSKCLIADDRFVICGSANLNDRSQLGTHDSEIAILINDPTPIQSTMAGQPWPASRFASSLRRQLFRKHLGLIRPQDIEKPDANYQPVGVPNNYDWDSPEDNLVRDPLSDTFLSFWNTRARTNTNAFRKAFRAVPDDYIQTWSEYKEFYEYFFSNADAGAEGKGETKLPPRVPYGHVVRDDFPGGVRELKELLSQIKGTLVEMPLCFLQNEDIAKEGLSLNALTEQLYT